MPSRNVTKEYVPDSFYHVYARGNSKQNIFLDVQDYKYFVSLFERYLSKDKAISKDGTAYPHFRDEIQLHAYCLMTNHFHLLIHQRKMDSLQRYMRSVMTSYSRYFNLRYKKSGSVFESRYKAVRIDKQSYFEHITRYIHLNPRRWENYNQSSLKYYIKGSEPEWLKTDFILSMFTSREEYYNFVANYEEMRDMLAEMKYQLADL